MTPRKYINRDTKEQKTAIHFSNPGLRQEIAEEIGSDPEPGWFYVWSGLYWIGMAPEVFRARFRCGVEQMEITL